MNFCSKSISHPISTICGARAYEIGSEPFTYSMISLPQVTRLWWYWPMGRSFGLPAMERHCHCGFWRLWRSEEWRTKFFTSRTIHHWVWDMQYLTRCWNPSTKGLGISLRGHNHRRHRALFQYRPLHDRTWAAVLALACLEWSRSESL